MPSVRGNGRSTIKELIDDKNLIRQENPATRAAPIPVDQIAEEFLARSGLSLESVVPDGHTVVVRDVNGITSGGDSKECLDSASEALKMAACGAVAAIPGMDWGGVDILVDSNSGQPYVMEVNTNASINGSMFPTFGTPRNLAGEVWSRISAASGPDTRTPPEPAPSGGAVKLAEVHKFDWGESNELSLRQMLQQELQGQGYRLEHLGPRIFTAEKSGATLWFAGSVTELDSFSSMRPVKSDALQRSIFAYAGVPTNPWRRVRNLDELQEFAAKHRGEVRLHPSGRSGAKMMPRILHRGQELTADLLDGSVSWIAQSKTPGTLLRVIATPERAVATLCSPGEVPVSEHRRTDAERVAALAVRAVPGLRWGAVDVVLPSEVEPVRGQTACVERMHRAPVFHWDDVVLSGSVGDVLRVIIAKDERS